MKLLFVARDPIARIQWALHAQRGARARALFTPVLPSRLTGRHPIAWPEPSPGDVERMTRELRGDAARLREMTDMAIARSPV